MTTDAERMTETKRVLALLAPYGGAEARTRIGELMIADMPPHDLLVVLHREIEALLRAGKIPAHLRPAGEELLRSQSESPVAEKIAEARHLASLLFAKGRTSEHERLLEILDNPMEDAARLEMLRYEAQALIDCLPEDDPLIPRLRKLAE